MKIKKSWKYTDKIELSTGKKIFIYLSKPEKWIKRTTPTLVPARKEISNEEIFNVLFKCYLSHKELVQSTSETLLDKYAEAIKQYIDGKERYETKHTMARRT